MKEHIRSPYLWVSLTCIALLGVAAVCGTSIVSTNEISFMNFHTLTNTPIKQFETVGNLSSRRISFDFAIRDLPTNKDSGYLGPLSQPFYGCGFNINLYPPQVIYFGC